LKKKRMRRKEDVKSHKKTKEERTVREKKKKTSKGPRGPGKPMTGEVRTGGNRRCVQSPRSNVSAGAS